MSKDFVLDAHGNKAYEGDEVFYRFSIFSLTYMRGVIGKSLKFHKDGLKICDKESLLPEIPIIKELSSGDIVKVTKSKETYTETTPRLALMDYIKDYIKKGEVYIILAESEYTRANYPKSLNIEVDLNRFTKELVTTVRGLSVDVETVVKKYESDEELFKDINNNWSQSYLLSLHDLDLDELLKIENNCTSVNYEF